MRRFIDLAPSGYQNCRDCKLTATQLRVHFHLKRKMSYIKADTSQHFYLTKYRTEKQTRLIYYASTNTRNTPCKPTEPQHSKEFQRYLVENIETDSSSLFFMLKNTIRLAFNSSNESV